MDEFAKVFEKIVTAGDAAVFFLAATIGYWAGGLESSISFGTGALGLKKAYDAIKAKQHELLAETRKPAEERARAEILLEILHREQELQPIILQLQKSLTLFDDNIINADQLKANIDEAIQGYLAHPHSAARKLTEGNADQESMTDGSTHSH